MSAERRLQTIYESAAHGVASKDELLARLTEERQKMLEALEAIHAWVLDVGGPIDRKDLWQPAFVKAHDLTESVLAEVRK